MWGDSLWGEEPGSEAETLIIALWRRKGRFRTPSIDFYQKSWNWWFWAVSKCSHTPYYVRNDVWCVFVSQEKKLFFMKKYFFAFCTTLRLCQSRARSWKSPISWKVMIFIDFHWFSFDLCRYSVDIPWKLMVLSGFKGLPHPALCQKRCVSCFCFPRKKHFFMKKYFSHFALLYGSARVEPDHENHQFSWKTMIFIDF